MVRTNLPKIHVIGSTNIQQNNIPKSIFKELNDLNFLIEILILEPSIYFIDLHFSFNNIYSRITFIKNKYFIFSLSLSIY